MGPCVGKNSSGPASEHRSRSQTKGGYAGRLEELPGFAEVRLARCPGSTVTVRIVDADDRPVEFQIIVPDDQEGGTYANFLAVWHTGHEFTLDFCATQPAQHSEEEDRVQLKAKVVSRIRIPPTFVFDVLKALNDNMSRYEKSYGGIRQPSGGED